MASNNANNNLPSSPAAVTQSAASSSNSLRSQTNALLLAKQSDLLHGVKWHQPAKSPPPSRQTLAAAGFNTCPTCKNSLPSKASESKAFSQAKSHAD